MMKAENSEIFGYLIAHDVVIKVKNYSWLIIESRTSQKC